MLDITLREFVDKFIPSTVNLCVTQKGNVVFEGTVDELYYNGKNLLNLTVAMVVAVDNAVCLICR